MRGAAVLVAGALDARAKEPPALAHPVVAMGRYLNAAGRRVSAEQPSRAVVFGGVAWAAGAAAAAGCALAVERAAGRLPVWLRTITLGAGLWPLFAHRMLLDEVEAVEAALGESLADGRAAVGRIVSRDVSELSATQVRAAAVESLAENLSDSLTAPLLWFAVGGLPGAALYRFANTADAMWGYRTDRWRHAGWVAARADDLLNLLPARLTGLVLAGWEVGPRTLRREARKTPSPNAGWPMAAMALRLGVCLDKPGVYTLADGNREPVGDDVHAALRLARTRGLGVVVAAAAAAGLLARRRETTCRR